MAEREVHEDPYPSQFAMEAAVELEVHSCLGRVQTQTVGKVIQRAIDKATATKAERSARIKELLAKYPESWVIEKEPHDYKDGTTHFTHVRYYANREWAKGEKVSVEIGGHLTPDLAELLVLLRGAADELAA